jgi:crossover junction endodeoxyribonuclease RuvC
VSDKHYFLGVDPGLNGALGIVDNTGRALVFDAPILHTKAKGKNAKVKRQYQLVQIVRLIRPYCMPAPSIAVIEQVGSRPEQGVTSMFTMGYGVGIWEMAFTFAGIPLTRISPVKWKNLVLQGVGHDKEAAVLRCQQLYPHIDLNGPHGGIKDGRADALMLATYGLLAWKQGLL